MLSIILKKVADIFIGNFIDVVFDVAWLFSDFEVLSVIAGILGVLAIAWRMYYLVTLSFITSPLFWISVILTIVKSF